MDLLKRQEIVIEKSTELKQLVGLALSLDECEEFVSDVLKASDKPSNCILGDVSECNCGENSTGYTEVKCCNICGLPIETETWHCNWHNEKPNS